MRPAFWLISSAGQAANSKFLRAAGRNPFDPIESSSGSPEKLLASPPARRHLPALFSKKRPYRPVVRTLPFHGSNTGSNPVRVTPCRNTLNMWALHRTSLQRRGICITHLHKGTSGNSEIADRILLSLQIVSDEISIERDFSAQTSVPRGSHNSFGEILRSP